MSEPSIRGILEELRGLWRNAQEGWECASAGGLDSAKYAGQTEAYGKAIGLLQVLEVRVVQALREAQDMDSTHGIITTTRWWRRIKVCSDRSGR